MIMKYAITLCLHGQFREHPLRYLFNNTDTCYFFLIKWKDAKQYSWDEIRIKKLYHRRIVVRDFNGKFDKTIQ